MTTIINLGKNNLASFVRHMKVETLMHSLNEMLGDPAKTYRQSAECWSSSLVEAIRKSAMEHANRNGFFKAQCDAIDLDPSAIADIGDFRRIPLIPVSMFKRPDAHLLLTCPLSEIENEIRSTGTSGIPSVARRDGRTLTRVLLAVTGIYREFLGLSGGTGIFLSPSTAEAPEMGMVKVFNILNGIFDKRLNLVENYTFDPGAAADLIRHEKGRMTRHIIGPPFLVARLLRHLESKSIDLRLDPDSVILTLGGWKRYTGESIQQEEFRARCHSLLGIDPGNMRDMYGMIESNMLAVECPYHRKHVPPWCYVSVRDMNDPTQALPNGVDGSIAILDPLNTSYPGFLLSDDVGSVEFGECGCGRTGQVVTFRRRREGAEIGCCAVSIERYLDDEATASCTLPR